MNYAAHYDRLILRARGRVLSGYRERHHVIPRCLGGSNAKGNLVDLTGEEHYVAHQLLVRMHPGHIGLAYAAVKMAWQATGNKPYGWLRRRYSQSRKGENYQRGRKRSLETRAKMSESRKGGKFPNRKRDYVFTPEHRAKLVAAKVGRARSAETIAKVAAAIRGRKLSDEHRAKLCAARRKRVTSAETRAKISASLTGKKFGPKSPELRAKLSAIAKALWSEGKCGNQWTLKVLRT